MSDRPAAILCTFSDFKLVKTRKLAQLIFELPIEKADEALAALGGLPRSDGERWCGIALVNKESVASSADAGPAIVRPADAEAKLPDKPRRPFSQMPRSQQCAIACQDDKFVAWFLSGTEISLCDDIDTEIKAVLDIASKRELDTNIPRGKLWDLLYARYCHETGRAAEDRS